MRYRTKSFVFIPTLVLIISVLGLMTMKYYPEYQDLFYVFFVYIAVIGGYAVGVIGIMHYDSHTGKEVMNKYKEK